MEKISLFLESYRVSNFSTLAFFNCLYVGSKKAYWAQVDFSEVFAGDRLVGFALSYNENFDEEITLKSAFAKKYEGYIPLEMALTMFPERILKPFIYEKREHHRYLYVNKRKLKEVGVFDKNGNLVAYNLYSRSFGIWKKEAIYVH